MNIKSVRRLAMFLLASILFPPFPVNAWDPDYAYGLPKQRRMCVHRESGGTVLLSSILPDEDCPVGSRRYIVIFGREPRGSIGFLPTSTSLKFYPPLVLSWPAGNDYSGSPLWHFTCVKPEELEVLQSRISLLRYKGEITSGGKKDCAEAQRRALKYCQQEWEGESLLEDCPIGWGIQ